MYASVLQMLYDRAHPRLSEADCTLLSAAVGCPDMDVMTSDKALADAINSERGPKAKGRVLDAMSSHHGRRQSTAKLIRNRLGSYIPKGARVEWYDRFHHTVFLIAGATVSIDHVEKGRVRVDAAGRLDEAMAPDPSCAFVHGAWAEAVFRPWPHLTGDPRMWQLWRRYAHKQGNRCRRHRTCRHE